MDRTKPGGASYIWANMELAISEAKKEGVVIVYSDGRSDTSYVLKEGEHEFHERVEDFEKFKRRIAAQVKEKNLQVHIISGTPEATDDLSDFAGMSANIQLSEVGSDKDLKKLLKDAATTKVLEIGEPEYAYMTRDAKGEYTAMGISRMPTLRTAGALKVVDGVSVDMETGRIEVRDLTFKDSNGRMKKLGIEDFSVTGCTEINYGAEWKRLPEGKRSPPVVTLALDSSSSMDEIVRLNRSQLDLLKEASKELCNRLIKSGARININAFNSKNKKVEIINSSNISKIHETIDEMTPEGHTTLRQNILLSILSTPQGGSIVTFTDAETTDFEYCDKIQKLAKAKGVKLHFIHYEDDYSQVSSLVTEEGDRFLTSDRDEVNKTITDWLESAERFRKDAAETGGRFESFKSYKDISKAFEEMEGHLRKEQSDIAVPLPKPKAALISITTNKGKELMLRYEL